MKKLLPALLAAAFAATTGPAHAFGALGHEVVGEIAARHLDPPAKKEVERLFGKPAGQALQDAATWPDEIKELPLYGPLGALHYVNFPAGTCQFRAERDCKDGRCVVEAIDRFAEKLKTASSDAVRAEAVKWVVHLVGDVHMPLHAGLASDKGGNDFQVQFEGAGSNLHRLWDSDMLGTRGRDANAYADEIGRTTKPRHTGGTSLEWATESCKLVADLYPKKRDIDDAYVSKHLPLADRRLHEAGLRLAAILNRTLDKPAVPVPYRK